MKNLRILLLCGCIPICSLFSTAKAQSFVLNEPNYNKPLLFDRLPGVLPVSIENLNNLVNSKTGAGISMVFSSGGQTILFEGTVSAASSKYEDKLQTVVIKSGNYDGATLYISKVKTDDGHIKYNGRLMGLEFGDLYVLRQKDGAFELVKKGFYDLVNE